MYKQDREQYLGKNEEEIDAQTKKDYLSMDNLMNILPAGVFYGQRPSNWWTLRHDIDLLYGTYKYGYATYTQMRMDKNLCFYKVDLVPHVYQEFPNADNITRRLKKLV